MERRLATVTASSKDLQVQLSRAEAELASCHREKDAEAQAALLKARERERRFVAMQAEVSASAQQAAMLERSVKELKEKVCRDVKCTIDCIAFP